MTKGREVQKVRGKQPRQERSRQTREAILQAGAQILRQEGLLGFNTNRVAEIAGVSIGSLYQYFPDKEEILRELVTRALDRRAEYLRSRIDASLFTLAPRDAIRKVIEAVVDGGSDDLRLEQILIQQVPWLIETGRFRKMDNQLLPLLMSTVQGVLKLRGIKLRKKDLELSFFILSQATRGVVGFSHAQGFEPHSRDQVIDELTDLVSRYLLSSDT